MRAEYQERAFAYDSVIRNDIPQIDARINAQIKEEFESGGFYNDEWSNEQREKIEADQSAKPATGATPVPEVILQDQPKIETYLNFVRDSYEEVMQSLETISFEWNGDGDDIIGYKSWAGGPEYYFGRDSFISEKGNLAYDANKAKFMKENETTAELVQEYGNVIRAITRVTSASNDNIANEVTAAFDPLNYDVQTDDPELGSRLRDTQSKLKAVRPRTTSEANAKRLGLDAVKIADEFLSSKDRENAERSLEIAETLATGTLPGLSWARDIYEAVVGLDLIDGRELSSLERLGAALGAAAGPLGSGTLAVLRRIKGAEGIGEIARDAERIREKARSVDGQSAKTMSQHADDRMAEIADALDSDLAAVEDRVEIAFDEGTRYWDLKEETMIFAEKTWDESPVGRLAPTMDIQSDTVTTVNRNFPSDTEAVRVTFEVEGNQIPRYRRLPDE